jgi:hypothetical protein
MSGLAYPRRRAAAYGMHFYELMDWYWRCMPFDGAKNPDVSDRPVSPGRERQVSGSRTFANAFALGTSHSIGKLGPERPERPLSPQFFIALAE